MTFRELLLQLVFPWMLMSISLYYGLVTVVKLLLALDLATLTSWDKFNEAWFGNFWVYMGPVSKEGAEAWVRPLLEGRVRQGDICQTVQHPVEGTVLEIGAGSGMWMDVLAQVTASSGKATKVYGVEPNPISAAALRRKVDELGMQGRYEVLPYGIEDLQAKADMQPGSVDCIVTVQCLCSIPEPDKNIRLLYEYLKPGGRWYVYEHVKAEEGLLVPAYQRFSNFFWTFFMGSCSMCRSTRSSILSVGSWRAVDLERRVDEGPLSVIPHTMGTLQKA
ncbi:S-adenosyl-L-methionine-dependent methyltransferase [Emericellopsis atlantica]|uniref:S-adenosyl-L-methionine-dependent methyltransferase n=1 Tax=Emericellopsis atlantica TaxID=2614577 RepID=A0A9P8CKM7_9HYPO|nr:S-adenosyl-L-methionine-dependent methyltransferase [Emericellopsis atlantica]KAG9250739.1 S-adenosyl-L-methionine-dependent methyltransferase [Emericellopsis atlantica]